MACMYLADFAGKKAISYLLYSRDLFLLVYLSFRTAMFHQLQGFRSVFSVVCSQIYFTGFQALPLVTALAFATGAMVVVQSASQLNILNSGGNFIGQIMVVVAVREVGPLLTALIVIARSGTAVASELGNLRVNREIEALEVMGINPMSYIVFPRIIGGIISVVCLALYFIVASFLGGFLVYTLFQGGHLQHYVSSIAQSIEMADVGMFLLKNFFSGTIIFAISCYQGLSVSEGPHQVPQVTTKAVMDSIIYVLMFNVTVTTLYYLRQMSQLGLI